MNRGDRAAGKRYGVSKPKAIVSWSTGKDCAYALYEAGRKEQVDVVGFLTTVTESFGRVSMHGVREILLDRQIEEIRSKSTPAVKTASSTPS